MCNYDIKQKLIRKKVKVMREVLILTKAIMRRWNHDKSQNYKIKSYTVGPFVNLNFFITLAFFFGHNHDLPNRVFPRSKMVFDGGGRTWLSTHTAKYPTHVNC